MEPPDKEVLLSVKKIKNNDIDCIVTPTTAWNSVLQLVHEAPTFVTGEIKQTDGACFSSIFCASRSR